MHNINATQDSPIENSPVATPRDKRRINYRWRVVDIVVASVLGVAAALIFFAWNQLYQPVTAPLEAGLPGSQALMYGVWLFAAVLGGLIIRKPGAALFTELVAATVSALLGAQWGGFLTIEAGLVQGLGAELVFLLFFYSYWRLPVALLAGAGAGLAMGVNDLALWYAGADVAFQVIYAVSAVISGTVIAGLGSWLLARGLAKTGVLSRFASGREGRTESVARPAR
ncbi:MAG: hypothetical protein JWL94_1477 [Microbacteriaceae bacterium]|nr:hypothetical protein [Microbacteriaceae bacterium]